MSVVSDISAPFNSWPANRSLGFRTYFGVVAFFGLSLGGSLSSTLRPYFNSMVLLNTVKYYDADFFETRNQFAE